MIIDFRIDFGYMYLYSRRHYHPFYIWDGCLECDNGEILETYQLFYPIVISGPGQTPKETKLSSPNWRLRTKRGVAAMRFVADVGENTVFHLKTVNFDFSFNASEIIENGRIDVMVGPKYLNCSVVITKTDYLWFRPEPVYGEQTFDIEKLGVQVHYWERMKLAWIEPGQSITWDANVMSSGADYCEQLLHLVAMALPAKFNPDAPELKPGTMITEELVNGHITLELCCDGKKIMDFTRYYRNHGAFLQLLEDDWRRFKVNPGRHTFTLKNLNDNLGIGISKLTLRNCEYTHGQLSIPEWALVGETIWGKVFAASDDRLLISCGKNKLFVDCIQGWNEFKIPTDNGGKLKFKCLKNVAAIDVYDIPEEKNPVKVGYDMTVVPHDDNGYMDWLLDYTHRTRLGNYVVFRDFMRDNPVVKEGEEEEGQGLLSFTNDDAKYKNNKKDLYRKWGAFCRTHGIYVSACEKFMDGSLINGAGEMFSDCGKHEFPGKVYAFDPKEPHASQDMKEATEKFISFLKADIDETHTVSNCVAYGDASGGVRHSYIAGVDFVRAETMVGHTMTLLSQVRPASEALGNGRWGVHIAMQHNHQIYHENHLGLYFLSLMQPWVMGANTLYEEDSLFEMWKEEHQTWDDALTKGKRDMSRNFFKFVKTHPRNGNCVRNIAFLEGRYAAPFNGFICDYEQDPHYSVWGLFGNNDPTWGHGQPEKCRQVLDVLMPGASTHPFRQKFDKRRFFFSGTPYGDFDCIPIEADADYFNNYKLILNLGWNTAIPEDVDKLKKFVNGGGVLLTGITQFSKHIKRDFLADMNDLMLMNDGDLSEFCGVKVIGRGEEYCGQYNCKEKEKMPEPELSAMPSDSTEEDGKAYMADVELCGAEIVAWDTYTGLPLLVRNSIGKGYVYTFTIWAFPGHEKFREFCAAWVAKLSSETLGGVYVEDFSREVFWTVWKDGEKTKLYILNTDWSTKDNVKSVNIVNDCNKLNVDIPERTLVCADISDKIKVEKFRI
ncbi:MAG: hypothetical protein E7588_01625 [Ruminococcaceae bacterium]|nr:hypothetical protein [Oscillospiraceae bacterium]